MAISAHAHAVKHDQKRLKRGQIAKISAFLYKIDVTENDGEIIWFQTGNKNNSISAHAQRKMAKNGYECFPVVEILDLKEIGVAGGIMSE